MSKLIATLANSGWTSVNSIAEGLEGAGLPAPDSSYLENAFTKEEWCECERSLERLAEAFEECRFGDSVTWGPLLVPNPDFLDTRKVISPRIRGDQAEISKNDFVDERLPAGVNICPKASPWALVATVVSSGGLAMGSFDDVNSSGLMYSVAGSDTRAMMLRQTWGALTLQATPELPDSERRESWTFSLFAGEALVEGKAISGTVLHGEARQRLGKTSRGIVSARVRPGLFIAGAKR